VSAAAIDPGELRDLVDRIEGAISDARRAVAKDRQVTSDRDLMDARAHLDKALLAIADARRAGTVPRW